MKIDDLFSVVAERVQGRLRTHLALPERTVAWVVVKDELGVEIAETASADAVPHEIIQELVTQGAEGAAFVTFVPGLTPRLVATALVAEPANSDIRRSDVRVVSSVAEVGPWEYTV